MKNVILAVFTATFALATPVFADNNPEPTQSTALPAISQHPPQLPTDAELRERWEKSLTVSCKRVGGGKLITTFYTQDVEDGYTQLIVMKLNDALIATEEKTVTKTRLEVRSTIRTVSGDAWMTFNTYPYNSTAEKTLDLQCKALGIAPDQLEHCTFRTSGPISAK